MHGANFLVALFAVTSSRGLNPTLVLYAQKQTMAVELLWSLPDTNPPRESEVGEQGIITVLVYGGRTGSAEAQVCRAAGPRREARSGAGG